MRTVLFLCSGNACRSPFAELLFNHLATEHGIKWRAHSRGLMLDWMDVPLQVAPEVAESLSTRELTVPEQFHAPQQVDIEDFTSADVIIAVNESEHRPVFQARFPEWEDEVEFWDIQDVILASQAQGLHQLSSMVELLVEDLTDIAVPAY